MVDEGRILIRIYSEGEDVLSGWRTTVSVCQRNSVGRSFIRSRGDNSGIGIKNVNDRIKIYFEKSTVFP